MNTATPSSKNKKALIFFSSPNDKSFTKQALEIFLSHLDKNISTEIVDVFKTQITPCIDCKGCMTDGICPFNDDGMGDILNKIDTADIIICATPIYFNSVPAKFKAVFDRLQQLFVGKFFLKKPRYANKQRLGILISTAGSNDDFATKSINAMFSLFYKSINAEFLSHFVISETDSYKPQEIILNQTILEDTLKRINE